jgi:hypothetical protein
MDNTVSAPVAIFGIIAAFILGAIVYSVYSWYTSGETWIGRKFVASTVDMIQVACVQAIAAVSQIQGETNLTWGWFLILVFNCAFGGAGIVGVSSKTKRDTNAVNLEADAAIPGE